MPLSMTPDGTGWCVGYVLDLHLGGHELEFRWGKHPWFSLVPQATCAIAHRLAVPMLKASVNKPPWRATKQ
jgi:hypothetical protein